MTEPSPSEPDRTAVHAPASTEFPAENLAVSLLSFPIALSPFPRSEQVLQRRPSLFVAGLDLTPDVLRRGVPGGLHGELDTVPGVHLAQKSVPQRVGGRGDSGTLRRRGYRVKPRDGHHASAAGRRSQCQRGVMRIRKRLQRLEQRARAGRVKPPEERPASGSFAHPDDTLLALGMLLESWGNCLLDK